MLEILATLRKGEVPATNSFIADRIIKYERFREQRTSQFAVLEKELEKALVESKASAWKRKEKAKGTQESQQVRAIRDEISALYAEIANLDADSALLIQVVNEQIESERQNDEFHAWIASGGSLAMPDFLQRSDDWERKEFLKTADTLKRTPLPRPRPRPCPCPETDDTGAWVPLTTEVYLKTYA